MTNFIKKNELKNDWYIIDGTNAVVGRLATIIAKIIRGKKIARHVNAMIVPGSGLVKQQAEEEGLDKLFKSFNDPEKYGTQSIAPIDAVAQNWVIFMANVVRNPKFFKGYPIPTDTKTKFYDVKGEDPNTYHAGKFANAILETIKDYIQLLEIRLQMRFILKPLMV